MSLTNTTLITEARRFTSYLRTRQALHEMSKATRKDLDMCNRDFGKLAQQAVYGR